MVDVKTEILIDAPIEKVSAYASNPEHATQWYKNIKSAKWKSPKPLGVGSLIAFTANFLGRKLEYTYEIITLDPGKKLVMRTAEGPFPMETTYTWEDAGNHNTKMTLRNKGELTGFSKLVPRLISFMMRRANRKDLNKIKEILERRERS
jgi:uncharacterized membrane protein